MSIADKIAQLDELLALWPDHGCYTRVIPRDLFNEAKFLKCLGQVSLILHDRVGVHWPLTMELLVPEAGFLIAQDRSDGGLVCPNLTLRLDLSQLHPAPVNVKPVEIRLKSRLNSRDAYPLLFCVGGVEGEALNDQGQLSNEFVAWLDNECGYPTDVYPLPTMTDYLPGAQ